MAEPAFDYSNLSHRPRGRFVQLASAVSRGVRTVQEQAVPFAHAWRESNLAALRGDGPLWVALGDSMTQGLGAPTPWQGWVGQLADSLAAAGRGHRVVNLSVTGARVGDVLERQLPALAALGVEPALVTVLIGSNDVIRRKYRAGLPGRFAAMLDGLPDGSVVANLPNANAEADEIDAMIRDRVRAGRLHLAEFRGPRTMSWRGKLASDHFHPNELGYADMAAVFAEALPR